MDTSMLKFAKPEPRKTTKGRKTRAERRVKKSVRQECVERDGYCRVARDCVWPVGGGIGCDGLSEWAHFAAHKRARTRGQTPERRHTTAGSLMLCRRHHRWYDTGGLLIHARTSAGYDGPLLYRVAP